MSMLDELVHDMVRRTILQPIVDAIVSTQKVPGKIDPRRLRRQMRRMFEGKSCKALQVKK